MPNSSPACSRSSAAFSVSCAERVSARSTDNCLVARMYAAANRWPGRVPVKYSDLAAKVTGRVSTSGRKIESTRDRWLDARMAPPAGGMYSPPVTLGRHNRCRIGPAITRETRYFTRPSTPFASRVSTIAAWHPSKGVRRATWPRTDSAPGHTPQPPSPPGTDVLRSGPWRKRRCGLRRRRGPGGDGRPVVGTQEHCDMPGAQRPGRARYLGKRSAVHGLGQEQGLGLLPRVVADQALL